VELAKLLELLELPELLKLLETKLLEIFRLNLASD
jgi:hypothetical protein